jgi:hypothetical protein
VREQKFGERRFWIKGLEISMKKIGIRTVGCKNIEQRKKIRIIITNSMKPRSF